MEELINIFLFLKLQLSVKNIYIRKIYILFVFRYYYKSAIYYNTN